MNAYQICLLVTIRIVVGIVSERQKREIESRSRTNVVWPDIACPQQKVLKLANLKLTLG